MPEKTLVLRQVIDLYPRMVGLLKAAQELILHTCVMSPSYRTSIKQCVRCQIQALLKQAEGGE
jgi:hypothetical protein